MKYIGRHRLSANWTWYQVFDKRGRMTGQPFRINLNGGAFK